MKKLYLIAATFALMYSNVYAAEIIAIVDIKKIADESLASKDINKQIEAKRDTFQKEVNKEEEELRKEDQELAKQRNVLSKEAFEQKAKVLRDKVVEFQRKVQMRRTTLENAYVKALSRVQDTILEIIKNLAAEKEFSVAIPKAHILYAKETLDISNDVLKALDKKLPKVEVQIEEIKSEKKSDKKKD